MQRLLFALVTLTALARCDGARQVDDAGRVASDAVAPFETSRPAGDAQDVGAEDAVARDSEVGAPDAGPPPPEETPLALACQAAVDRLAAVHAEAGEPPEYLLETDAPLRGTEWDAMETLQALDRLSMQDGWVLDYVYWADGGPGGAMALGGAPELYARRADAPRFPGYAEYREAMNDAVAREAASPFAHLQPDGTAESYCQLAVFLLMGNQFLLYWHACYDDELVVATRPALEAILADADIFGSNPLAEDSLAAVRAIELAPSVTFGDGLATVELISFSKWTGFSRVLTRFSATAPRTRPRPSRNVLVPWSCGWMY